MTELQPGKYIKVIRDGDVSSKTRLQTTLRVPVGGSVTITNGAQPPPVDPPPEPPPSGVVRTFSPGVTAATLTAALADDTVDVIELTPGTYSPGAISASARRTRPVLFHPQMPGTVTFDGKGSADCPFSVTGANMTFDDLIFVNYLIGERGLFTLGYSLNIAMNRITLRNCNGTRPTYSWALYLSSYGGGGQVNTTANDWNIEGVAAKTLSGFHSEHDPNARGGSFKRWRVKNVPFALYVASDAKDIFFEDWTITDSGSSHDGGFHAVVFAWATGGIKDICLVNSGTFYVYPSQPFVDQRACVTP